MNIGKEKRKEYRGHGELHGVGLGTFGSAIKRVVFVEREPDNLMAAAIMQYCMQGEFHLIFTDRHSINFEVAAHDDVLATADEIIVLCPSINEYSVDYLRRATDKPVSYIGSTTKLKERFGEVVEQSGVHSLEYGNVVLHLTDESVCRLVADQFNIHRTAIDEVIIYTERLIPKDVELYTIMRHQYLHFAHQAIEHYKMFLDYLSSDQDRLLCSEEEELRMKQIYEREMAYSKRCLEQAVICEKDGMKIAFMQGGCPCTLILNMALREMCCDLAVNTCVYRQHFTVLARYKQHQQAEVDDYEVQSVYPCFVQNFIYSGMGPFSGGGCYGMDYTFDEFVDAFINHKKIHGFYKERAYGYDVFDPSDHEWIRYNEKSYLYRNFNFTIFLDDYCNADCRFCIEQIKTENTGLIMKCGKITEIDRYLERLDAVLGKIRIFNPSVSVTGGEPLISPMFPGVMKLLKKHHFRKTVITSNGTDILEHVDEIIDAGISHVNISRPHFDETIVQNIMRFRNGMVGFANLKTAIARLQEHGVVTRFNCIISKDGIHSVDDMKAYMDYIRKLGCKHVVFREMMSFNEQTSKNEEKKEYSAKNRILMNDLWQQIDDENNNQFTPFASVRGHYYYIEMYTYKDVYMVSERANLKCLEDERLKNNSYIYEMVFHPNGNLCAGWNENEDILDANC